MPQPFKINWTCNLTSWSSGTVGCNSDGSGGLEHLEKLLIYNSCNINKGMHVGGIPLIDKHWIMITYSGIGSYGCKYIILMKTYLKRNMTRLFLLPTLPDVKTDTSHLLQGHHSSSSLSNSSQVSQIKNTYR